jgi:hypothetical protein
LKDGDPYELSDGHPVLALPAGGRQASAALTGAAVLRSDPLVETAGVEAGHSPEPGTLRAPDVSVGNVPPEPGWVKGVPPLAVEYADTGQDERDLKAKIRELLGAGTRFVWVVRLTGPRRVEVHEPEREMRLVRPGEELLAPGVLANPVPVEALYDWEVGREVALRNLLQQRGYDGLDAVRREAAAEGETRGEIEASRRSIFEVLAARGLEIGEDVRRAVSTCHDPATLGRWLRLAVTARSAAELLTAPSG